MKKAVFDTSSLIRLRKAQVLEYLAAIFDKAYLPQAVKEECTDLETLHALKTPLFEVRQVHHVLPLGMGVGEREAISLAVELNVKTIITPAP